MTNAQPQQTTMQWRASLHRIPSLKTLHQSCPGGGSNTRVSAGAELGHGTAGSGLLPTSHFSRRLNSPLIGTHEGLLGSC